jgi:hypothetical protein
MLMSIFDMLKLYYHNVRQKGARKCVLLHLPVFLSNQHNVFVLDGGMTGTRTRDLCRDSLAFEPTAISAARTGWQGSQFLLRRIDSSNQIIQL